MRICSDKHPECAVEGNDWQRCPVCDLVEELEDKVQTLTDEVERLEEQE